MRLWKEHPTLRAVLMAIFVVLGVVLLIVGWKMTGQLTGLALMLAGVVLLLTALMLYNKPFEEPK
jgi:drug/metabolite transporter (DMT)-like permease